MQPCIARVTDERFGNLMADEPTAPVPEQENALDLFKYTAFEHWDYKQIIYKTEHKQSWRSMGESFYRASERLVKAVAEGQANEDIEGVAAVFLFRHYLELILKRIVFHGRWLTPEGESAANDQVENVAKVHELTLLWKWVLEDAKPKVPANEWDSIDTQSVEHCIAEFDNVHKRRRRG